MKKIPTLFLRDENDRAHVTSTPNPECAWVFEGEGVATRKYDGTCVLMDEGGNWWARREVKPGRTKPANFWAIDTDPNTGKTVGWEPYIQSSFAKFLNEAIDNVHAAEMTFEPGTYELIGPKINGNPEGEEQHWLVRHGRDPHRARLTLTFEGLRERLTELAAGGIEGIVWHHPDGRMAKLKGRDF